MKSPIPKVASSAQAVARADVLKLQQELRKELDQELSLNEPKRVGYREYESVVCFVYTFRSCAKRYS